ncbi:MAG: autotransporter outer membrane beta-barrel domain-containing protein, partial [Planctomycetota bacterium]|nr:autotransporter outer membrane beta-barrel domain-containing protein [Planctomycetota bacterium]
AQASELEDQTIGSRLTGYTQALGQFEDVDSERDRTGYSSNAYGALGGIDFRIDDEILAGLALSYLKTDADLNDDRGDVDVDTFRFGPYLSVTRERWTFDTAFAAGFSEFESKRKMPTLSRTAEGDYDGYDLSGFAQGTWSLLQKDRHRVALDGALQYTYFHYDSYEETGAGGANLTMPSNSTDSLLGRFGLRYEHRFAEMAKLVQFELLTGWEHQFLDADDIKGAFTSGGGRFSINPGGRDDDRWYYGAGLTMALASRASLFLHVNGDVSSGSNSVAIGGGFEWTF